jgi:hypothetical protein
MNARVYTRTLLSEALVEVEGTDKYAHNPWFLNTFNVNIGLIFGVILSSCYKFKFLLRSSREKEIPK